MTARGGGRVPDGIPRPEAIPFAQGPNRSDLSALPGTPGTTLPGPTSGVSHGRAGPIRRVMAGLPLQSFQAGIQGGLTGESTAPGEPVTSGSLRGAGAGPGARIPTPETLSNGQAASESRVFYPVLMKLASLPGATTQTKILAQRMRANLPIPPELMPLTPGEQKERESRDGILRSVGENPEGIV